LEEKKISKKKKGQDQKNEIREDGVGSPARLLSEREWGNAPRAKNAQKERISVPKNIGRLPIHGNEKRGPIENQDRGWEKTT